jgi:hypothetical protein
VFFKLSAVVTGIIAAPFLAAAAKTYPIIFTAGMALAFLAIASIAFRPARRVAVPVKFTVLTILVLVGTGSAFAQTRTADDWMYAQTIEQWYSRLPEDAVWVKTFDDGKLSRYEYRDCQVGMNEDFGVVLSTASLDTKYVVIISNMGRNDLRIPMTDDKTDYVGQKCAMAFPALPPLVQAKFAGNYGLGTPKKL